MMKIITYAVTHRILQQPHLIIFITVLQILSLCLGIMLEESGKIGIVATALGFNGAEDPLIYVLSTLPYVYIAAVAIIVIMYAFMENK